jgi:Flp pilus assembly protein TadD
MARASRCGLLLVAAALACSSGEKAPKVSLAQAKADSVHNAAGMQVEDALSPQGQAALDSGNVLFRRKAFDQALAQYRLASRLSPKSAAPIIGISMVADKMGNKALADSALSAIRERGAEAAVMQHPSIDSTRKKAPANVKKGPSS